MSFRSAKKRVVFFNLTRATREDSLYIYNIPMREQPRQMTMTREEPDEIEEALNGFAEVMSKLMIDQHQKQITELELTLLQVQALRVLRRGSVLTGKLAAELGISASAVTQLTDRLIRKGLIERHAAAGDRRSVLVALSAKGKRLVDGFRQRRTRFFTEALAQLSEAEHGRVVKAMKMVTKALESYGHNTGRKHGEEAHD